MNVHVKHYMGAGVQHNCGVLACRTSVGCWRAAQLLCGMHTNNRAIKRSLDRGALTPAPCTCWQLHPSWRAVAPDVWHIGV
eukprot:102080-Chlamydomonas_euryale.AAC.2